MPAPGEAVALYTDLLVREDLLQLFGFPTLAEREWHRLLTTVQGVGAKAALAILGALGTEGLARALALGDATAIRAAPGVGPKIAQRVVLELKRKGAGGDGDGRGGRARPAARAGDARRAAGGGGAGRGGGRRRRRRRMRCRRWSISATAPGEAAAAVAGRRGRGRPALIRAALRALAPKG